MNRHLKADIQIFRGNVDQALPLQPIRSLHYFVPVIEEVLTLPLLDNYLKLKMRSLAPTPKSNSGQRTPAAPL